MPPQHKEGEITALGERRESRKALPGAGSSIKFAVPLRCWRATGKKACEPFLWDDNRPEHSPHREIRSIVETNKGSCIKQPCKNIYEQSLKPSSGPSPCLYLVPGSARRTLVGAGVSGFRSPGKPGHCLEVTEVERGRSEVKVMPFLPGGSTLLPFASFFKSSRKLGVQSQILRAPGDLGEGRIPKVWFSPSAFGPTWSCQPPQPAASSGIYSLLEESFCFLLLQGHGKHPAWSI